VAEHVLAEAGHPEERRWSMALVAGERRRKDVDRLLAVDVAIDFPEDVEQATIIVVFPGCASRGGND